MREYCLRCGKVLHFPDWGGVAKRSLRWLKQVALVAFALGLILPVSCARNNAAAGDDEIDQQIDALASRNPPPLLVDPGPIPLFNEDFDWSDQVRVGTALDQLAESQARDGNVVWPHLIRHIRDQRYSITFASPTGRSARNATIGALCELMAVDDLLFAFKRHAPRIAQSANDAAEMWTPKELQEGIDSWHKVRPGKLFYECQIELCEWAISSAPGLMRLTEPQRREFIELVNGEISRLKTTRVPAKFPPRFRSGDLGFGRLNAQSAEEKRRIAIRDPATCLAISSDGGQLLMGTQRAVSVLWSAEEQHTRVRWLEYDLKTNTSAEIDYVVLSHDGTRFATAARADKRLSLFKLETSAGTGGSRSVAFPDIVAGMAFSQAGDSLWVALKGGSAMQIHTESGKVVRKFDGIAKTVRDLETKAPSGEWRPMSQMTSFAVSLDQKRIACATESWLREGAHGEPSLLVWDAVTGTEIARTQMSRPAREMTFSPQGTLLLTTSGDQNAILWDVKTGLKVFRTLTHVGIASCIAFNATGSSAVTTEKGEVLIWDASNGNLQRKFQAHSSDGISALAHTANRRFIITASYDGTSRIWDTNTAREQARLITFKEGRGWIVVTPEGLFECSPDGEQYLKYTLVKNLSTLLNKETRERYRRPGLLKRVLDGEIVSIDQK